MPKVPISVLVLTFNEEANLAAALDSVKDWAKEVFVVDSYSTDRSVDIALAREKDGVRVVQHCFENFASQWNWAIDNLPISQSWILKLDADERATPEFRDEVGKIVISSDAASAYVVHWRLIFMGKQLNWGGLYPNGNTRLWQRGKARFGIREVNEHLVIDGKVEGIRNPIEHHDYKSLSHWIDRHNRYSSLEARSKIQGNAFGETRPKLFGRPDERRMWLRRFYYLFPFRSFFYFVYRFVIRFGFLDGIVGFRFCFLHAVYMYWIDLKISEHRHQDVSPEVIWPARGEPHPVVKTSNLQQLVESKNKADNCNL